MRQEVETMDQGELEYEIAVSWSVPPDEPEACRLWFERMWAGVCTVRTRYALPLRRGWWARPLQLEALAALVEWLAHFDHGDWDDPGGKIGLLLDLERIGGLLREGAEPFQPERDLAEFQIYVESYVAAVIQANANPGT
jgi:hypothetical protein